MTFGKFLTNARKQNGYKSQRQLALKCKVSNATITRLEADTQKPTVETIKAISDCFTTISFHDLMMAAGYAYGNEEENKQLLEWKQRAFKAERKNDELREIVEYYTKAFNDIPTFAKVMIRAQVLLEEE